jgi:hypothetical protein
MIDKYNDFLHLNAFDLDDTLIITKRFEEVLLPYINENVNLKDTIENILKKYNKDITDLNYENGRLYLFDPNREIDENKEKNFIRKNSRIYLTTPENFFLSEDGESDSTNTEIVNLYNKSKNRSIITIRKDKYRKQTLEMLNKLGIKYPNAGLFMYPFDIIYNKAKWKSQILEELLLKYVNVSYYDNDVKVLKRIKKYINNDNLTLYHVKGNNYRKL